MKKIFNIKLIIILLLVSCGQNSYEKQLNGKWYETKSNSITRLVFKPDSLTIIELHTQKVKWKANKEKIEFDYELLFSDSLGEKFKKAIFNYELFTEKDLLKTVIVKPDDTIEVNFIRANNYIDYLNKKSGIKFSLPEDKSVDFLKNYNKYALNIFIGYKDEKIQACTEFSDNLDYLNSDIEKFISLIVNKDVFHDEMIGRRLHYRVYVDKNILSSVLENYVKELKESNIKKVYQIYQTEEFEHLHSLRGKQL